MIKIFTRLSRYGLIGILNTLLHWTIFLIMYGYVEQSQSISNLTAFFVAVTVSFYLNARYTFKVTANLRRYAIFVSFMALLSFLVGYIADQIHLLPIITLVLFTAISFIIGFLFSNYLVFKD